MGKSKEAAKRAFAKRQDLLHSKREAVNMVGGDVRMSTLTIGTTDDTQANKFIEYDLDFYFATNGQKLDLGTPMVSYPARQCNIDLSTLPGVDRNDDSVNKRPVLVSGSLYVRPQFNVTGNTEKFEYNPNILNGRLVTPLGVDLGGGGNTNAVALYDNAVFNLEPNVNQNYVHVNTYHYMNAMPEVAPASAKIGGADYTNLFCFGLVQPNGAKWTYPSEWAFRFSLKYRVPVILEADCQFAYNYEADQGPTPSDGILTLARNIKDVILPAIGNSVDVAVLERPCFPDARKILSQK